MSDLVERLVKDAAMNLELPVVSHLQKTGALEQEAADEIERLRKRVEELEGAYDVMKRQHDFQFDNCKRAEAALRECLQHADALSDSLIFEVEARYGNGIKDHPAMRRKYEADMSEVKAYRAWRAER